MPPRLALHFRREKVAQMYNFLYFCTMKKKIIAFGDYFYDFMRKLPERAKDKIGRALLLLETEDKIPYHYIKYIRDGLYEFRVSLGNNEYRLFFIYDGEVLVILLNCFQKKSQKTPKAEIDKALRLKKEYYEQKEGL